MPGAASRRGGADAPVRPGFGGQHEHIAAAAAGRGEPFGASGRPADPRHHGPQAPAYARNGRFDILATNRLGRALFSDAFADGATSFNLARYLFLDDRSREFYVDWATVARDSAASLRQEARRNPYDKGLTDLVGELSTRSTEFREWWAAHDVKLHRTATKRMTHPVVGELELTGEALVLPGDVGLTLITYTVEPASPSSAALEFLSSWATTPVVSGTD